jgi:hypothetical protein
MSPHVREGATPLRAWNFSSSSGKGVFQQNRSRSDGRVSRKPPLALARTDTGRQIKLRPLQLNPQLRSWQPQLLFRLGHNYRSCRPAQSFSFASSLFPFASFASTPLNVDPRSARLLVELDMLDEGDLSLIVPHHVVTVHPVAVRLKVVGAFDALQPTRRE